MSDDGEPREDGHPWRMRLVNGGVACLGMLLAAVGGFSLLALDFGILIDIVESPFFMGPVVVMLVLAGLTGMIFRRRRWAMSFFAGVLFGLAAVAVPHAVMLMAGRM